MDSLHDEWIHIWIDGWLDVGMDRSMYVWMDGRNPLLISLGLGY